MFTVMFTPMAIRCITCFHPISIPIMTLNQILHKRLGSWCRFSLVIHTMVLKTDIWQWPRISNVFCVCCLFRLWSFIIIIFFNVASHFIFFLFRTKDLGLWYLWGRHQQNGCTRWTVNLHHQMIHVSVSLYVAKALLYQQLYSFQF